MASTDKQGIKEESEDAMRERLAFLLDVPKEQIKAESKVVHDISGLHRYKAYVTAQVKELHFSASYNLFGQPESVAYLRNLCYVPSRYYIPPERQRVWRPRINDLADLQKALKMEDRYGHMQPADPGAQLAQHLGTPLIGWAAFFVSFIVMYLFTVSDHNLPPSSLEGLSELMLALVFAYMMKSFSDSVMGLILLRSVKDRTTQLDVDKDRDKQLIDWDLEPSLARQLLSEDETVASKRPETATG